jgi:hypothetical protein
LNESPLVPKVIRDHSIFILTILVTVNEKLRKPKVHTRVNIRAKKQEVQGLEADQYPALKKALLSKPIFMLYN